MVQSLLVVGSSMRLVSLSCLWLAMPACFAGALPPSRSDVGLTMQQPDGEMRSGVRVSTGAHLASATLNEAQDYDIGVGYVFERVEESGGDITQTMDADAGRPRTSHGAYISAAKLLTNNMRESHRTWLGVRAEYLDGSEANGGDSVSVLARTTWEIFGAGEGAGAQSDSCGGAAGYAYGTSALGLYLEGGARRSLDNEASFAATVGVSMRLPFVFGFAYNFCGD